MVLQKNSVSRRAQSIGVNTIVIIALAIIVLVVLLAIFGKQVINYNGGIDSATPICKAQSGVCSENVPITSSGATYEELSPPIASASWQDCKTKCWKEVKKS